MKPQRMRLSADKENVIADVVSSVMKTLYGMSMMFGIKREVGGKAEINGEFYRLRMCNEEWHNDQRKKDLQMFFLSANDAQEEENFDLDKFADEYIERNDNF